MIKKIFSVFPVEDKDFFAVHPDRKFRFREMRDGVVIVARDGCSMTVSTKEFAELLDNAAERLFAERLDFAGVPT